MLWYPDDWLSNLNEFNPIITMKNYSFMKQVKKHLKNNTKKELIQKVLIWMELNVQQTLSEWERYDDLFQELLEYKRQLEQTEWFLRSAESALRMYENFSIFQFIKHKYAK